MAELIPPGPPQAPEQYNHTAYFTDPVLPMEGLENDAYYRAPVQQISTQTFTALCKEFCAQVPKFGGQSGEDVVKFIKRVDQTMHDLRMTSGQVAAALWSPNSPLHDRAATFFNHARSNKSETSKYRHATYWCAQEAVPGRGWIPYQARRPSVDSINESEASADSEDSVATAGSIASAASQGVQGQDDHVPHVVGVHGEARRQDQRTRHIPRIHRRHAVHRRHRQQHRDQVPDQPAVPDLPHVWANQCLRHFIYHEFYEKPNRDAIEKKFELSKIQKPRQSVREYIWALKIAHDVYKLARFGKLTVQQQQERREDDDYTLTDIIKNNCIKDFKSFIQSKLTTDPDCLTTVDQMEDIAKKFETMTDVGKNHTKSCTSDAKPLPVMALKNQDYVNLSENSGHMSEHMMLSQNQASGSANYNPSYFSMNYVPQVGVSSQIPPRQQSYTYSDQSQFQPGAPAPAPQVPPMPDYLVNQISDDAWQAACSANQQQHAVQYKAEIDATVARISAAAAQPPRGGGRGGNRGNRGGGKGGRGGKGRGAPGANNQQTPPPPPPPPNILPHGYTDYWTPTPAQEAKCIHANNGRPRCTYCGVCGHGFTTCGYKREDVKNGKNWNIHPKRGLLLPKKTNSNRYLTYKRQQTAAAASIANFSDFVMTLSNEPQQQQSQQQEQQEATGAVAAIRAELITARAELTALRQQQGSHQVSAAATTSKPTVHFEPQQPQGGCLPKPVRPPSTTQVPQPGLPPKPTTEECYTIISDWASLSAERTAQIPPDQLHRQEKEYLQLVQNLQTSKEAEEEHDLWCP